MCGSARRSRIKAAVVAVLSAVVAAGTGVAAGVGSADSVQVGPVEPGPQWSSPTAPEGPALADFAAAFAYSLSVPNAAPAGANDFHCSPSARYPKPVVLVHGTAENAYANWAAMSPYLKARGYCVFAINFGGPDWSPIKGIGPMNASAGELGRYIDTVLAATGASRVDLVGHSQGGTLPRVLLKENGWWAKIDKIVGLASTNYGSTGSGVLSTIAALPGGTGALETVAPAFSEWTLGSDYMAALNAGPEVVPGVDFTNIATRYDEVITPYQNAFLRYPGAKNLVVQDYCATDFADHLALPYDPVALQLTVNALDPVSAKPPDCRVVRPVSNSPAGR